jgi:hypothetical protein
MLEGPEAAEIKINSTGKGSKYPVEVNYYLHNAMIVFI